MSLALSPARWFVGIDWAMGSHGVCVMDDSGKITAEFVIAHSTNGIASLIGRLCKLGDPAAVPIAIERPNGRLVDLLPWPASWRSSTATATPPPRRCTSCRRRW